MPKYFQRCMTMARPGGNPNITDFSFESKHNWQGSCTERMTLKMPLNMKQAIKDGELGDWQEICRRAIARELGWEMPNLDEG